MSSKDDLNRLFVSLARHQHRMQLLSILTDSAAQ